MDPTFAKSLPFKPHNETSNQLLVNEQISIPENREMFLRAVKEFKDQGWSAVLDQIVRFLTFPFSSLCHNLTQNLRRVFSSAHRTSITFKVEFPSKPLLSMHTIPNK
jgi:hypothetical protein